MYLYLEAIYHVPVSFWAVRALLRSTFTTSFGCPAVEWLTLSLCADDSKVPLQLLVYAMQTGVTTATCIADFLSWSSFSNAEKVELAKLYVPYLAFCESCCPDSLSRVLWGLVLIPNSCVHGCRHVCKTECRSKKRAAGFEPKEEGLKRQRRKEVAILVASSTGSVGQSTINCCMRSALPSLPT